jgi:hypothetical protein
MVGGEIQRIMHHLIDTTSSEDMRMLKSASTWCYPHQPARLAGDVNYLYLIL